MRDRVKHKGILKHLKRISRFKKKERCELIYKVHKKHGISKKTLFYVKEYGPHTNVMKTILKESIKILLLASIVSSIGGFALENIKYMFMSIIPLVILLPALNDMIGDYGTIISSKFSNMLHMGKVRRDLLSDKDLRKLFLQIFIIAILLSLLGSGIALIISSFSGFPLTADLSYKIFLVTIIDVALLVIILFSIAILAGIYFYKKKEDPNNFLIPITTSIADFGNMIILALLVILIL